MYKRQVLRQASEEPLLDRFDARSVTAEYAEPVLCQVDGDVVGTVRRIRFDVVPAAVRVVLPAGPTQKSLIVRLRVVVDTQHDI